MKGEIPSNTLWRSVDESAIFSAINNYLGANISFSDLETHFDVINYRGVNEWKVGDKCWRIITRLHKNSDENIHDYSVGMYLLDWDSRPYVYDYNLTDEMSTDKLYFIIRIDIDDNIWEIEEVADFY